MPIASQKTVERLVALHDNKLFQGGVISVIILSALVIGANTYEIGPRTRQVIVVLDAGITVFHVVPTVRGAEKAVAAGVDGLVVEGIEGGGFKNADGASTMVLVPEVAQAVAGSGVPILAAGGIVQGRQLAAAMAMGAHGAWTGSMWLTTAEAETSPVIKEKYVQASSRQTVRSKARTGKYSRQLVSAWTDAWESEEAPDPLPMPLQSLVAEAPLAKVAKLAEGGHADARQLATYFVGQGVGLMNSVQSTRDVVREFMEDYLSAVERMNATLEQ